MKENEHPLIRFLEYGFYNSEFTLEDAHKAIGSPDDDVWNMVRQNTIRASGLGKNPRTYTLQPESVINYLEYRELQHAYKSSRTSTRIAITAIIISTLIGFASIAASLKEFWIPYLG